MKNRIRRELGFQGRSLRFAERFFQTDSLTGKLSRSTLEAMLRDYPEE